MCFYAPADAENILRDLAGADYAYLAQSDGDLGARMEQVFTDLWRLGHRNIVLIGSDLPALPWAILDEAFSAVGAGGSDGWSWGRAGTAAIILVGMNQPTPEIFARHDLEP